MSKHTNNTASNPGADSARASLHLGVDIGGTHISAALALDGKADFHDSRLGALN